MAEQSVHYPKKRSALLAEWSPSIHYAQFQTMPTGALPKRRIYDFELLYVSQGEAATTMNGARHELHAGQLIYLPAGVYHQNEIVSKPAARFLGIHFDYFDELDIQSESDMVANELAVREEKFSCEPCTEGYVPLSAHAVYTPSHICIQFMEQLVEEFTMRPLGYELACKALMLQILSHLQRLAQTYALPKTTLHGARIVELIGMIEADPAARWTSEAIASYLNLSVDHATKLFKQVAGRSPNEYIRSIRHREARRWLRESELSVEEVGEKIGYPDIHYFSRIFRRQEGISPREYRKISRIL